MCEEKLDGHTDWVRDVAWSPSVGLPLSRIASCSQVEREREREREMVHSFFSGLQGDHLDT